MIDHSGLVTLNISKNCKFTIPLVQDFCKFVLKGQNKIREINLSQCQIDSYQMSILLPNLKELTSLKRLYLSDVKKNYKPFIREYLQKNAQKGINVDGQSINILALGAAIRNYTGNRYLEYLDLSENQITNKDLQELNQSLSITIRTIQVRGLNLRQNQIKLDSQSEIRSLEDIMLKLALVEINLSENEIQEIMHPQVLALKLLRIDLSYNQITEIPNNFFLNVRSLNLAGNKINTKGAYQISQILTQPKIQWTELNLNDTEIQTKGFISLVYALIENSSLQNLSVAHNKIKGEGILVYIFNYDQLQLKYLDLSANMLRYDLVYALLSMMKYSKLKTLILANLQQEAEQISSGKDEPFEIQSASLKELDFQKNECMIKPIINSLSRTYNRLEYINLSSNKLGDQPALQLIHLLSELIKKSYTLQTLILADNCLGKIESNLEFELLESAFRENFTLGHLDLSCNKLETKILCLVNGLKLCANLKYLNLANNGINESDILLEEFSNILENHNLLTINLANNYIKSQTLDSFRLKCIERNRVFPHINLSGQKLSADDLLVLADIIGDFQIKSLDISRNKNINSLNDFLMFRGQKRIQSLSINAVIPRSNLFENMGLRQYRYLKIMEISTFLTQYQFSLLLNCLKNFTYLQALVFDYQFIDNEISNQLMESVQDFLRLRHLSIRKCGALLGSQFFQFIHKLLEQSKKLTELNLKDNFVNDEGLEELNLGLIDQHCLNKISLAHCRLGDQQMRIIEEGLFYQSIQIVDLSENNISSHFYKYLFDKIKSEGIIEATKFTQIKLKQSNSDFLLYIPENAENIFPDLKRLNLANNLISEVRLRSIVKLTNDLALSYLTLENCNLGDEVAFILKHLMLQNIYELNLSQNRLTNIGFKTIFNHLLSNKCTLRLLNVSQNKISQGCFDNISFRLNSLQILLMNGNVFSRKMDGDPGECFFQLLRTNPSLYIYNEWENISEQLANQIISSYITFTSLFNIQGSTPYYLAQIYIVNSKLSDDFFIWFGKNFFKMPKLEIITFTGSHLITTMGKMHMYISMINENHVNYNLREVYFDDKRSYPTYFDDGILRYLLISLKNKILMQKITKYEYNSETSQNSNIRWGTFGKWLIHIINNTLNQLQTLNIQQFKISSSLYDYIRKNQSNLNSLLFASILTEVSKLTLAFLQLINIDYKKATPSYYDSKCYDSCFYQNFSTVLYISSMLYLSIILLTVTQNLIRTYGMRRIATPDNCIITTLMKKYITYRFIHKKEFFLLFFEIISQLNYFVELRIIKNSLQNIEFIHESSSIDFDDLSSAFTILIVLMLLNVILRFIWNLVLNIRSTVRLLKSINLDQATYMNNLWIQAQHSNRYMMEDVLANYCPQGGVKVRNQLFNYKQSYELVQCLFELTSIICHAMYFSYQFRFFNTLGFSSINNSTLILVRLSIAKTWVKFFFNLFNTLTTRPPEVKVHDINEALLIRRYQEMGNANRLVFRGSAENKYIRRQIKQRVSVKPPTNFDQFGLVRSKSEKQVHLRNDIAENDVENDLQDEENDNFIRQPTNNLYMKKSLRKLIEQFT